VNAATSIRQAAFFAFALLAASHVHAQAWSLDPSVAPVFVTDTSLLLTRRRPAPGSQFLAYGDFTHINARRARLGVRLGSDGKTRSVLRGRPSRGRAHHKASPRCPTVAARLCRIEWAKDNYLTPPVVLPRTGGWSVDPSTFCRVCAPTVGVIDLTGRTTPGPP